MTSLIVFLAIILLGIFHIIYDFRVIGKRIVVVNTYLDVLVRFFNKNTNNQDTTIDKDYLLANGEEVSEYMGETIYNAPVSMINAYLTNGRLYEIEDEIKKALNNKPAALAKLEKDKRKIKWQFFNPFVWFYRGIEVLSLIIFGYIIENGSLKYRGKVWGVLNTIFSLVAGSASIISLYLQLYH